MGNSPKDELVRSTIGSILPKENIFVTISGVSAFSPDYKCSVPADMSSGVSNVLVELAFRYTAKVMTATYCNDTHSNPLDYTVAGRSIENLKWRLSRSYYQELLERYDYALMNLQNYIETGEGNGENIIQHCWYLAKLDLCYRRGAVPSDVNQFFEYATSYEVQEIMDLATDFRENFLSRVVTPASNVEFNPSFGLGEALLCETDSDMIIDGALVDLRTEMGNFYPKNRIMKSLTYLMMTEINSRFQRAGEDYVIDRLMFYNGRYSETEVLYVEDIPVDIYEKCVEKMVIITEVNYKAPRNNSQKENYSAKNNRREAFLEDYQSSREDYDDNYNQVITKKNHHIFAKILVAIIIISILVIAFAYGKSWYVANYGEDFSFTSIIDNLFGCINIKNMI
jgi:hypothetical protein